MSESDSDPVEDLASLWTTSTPAPQEADQPQQWVWEAMEPPERRSRLRELAKWVAWLRRTFQLHNTIPPCWYQHPPVVEHLTALYVGWVRTYAGGKPPSRELSEAEWINTLHALVPRIQLAACAAGHQPPPPPPPPRPDADAEFEAFLHTTAMTAPAYHPAEAEAARLDPPL